MFLPSCLPPYVAPLCELATAPMSLGSCACPVGAGLSLGKAESASKQSCFSLVGSYPGPPFDAPCLIRGLFLSGGGLPKLTKLLLWPPDFIDIGKGNPWNYKVALAEVSTMAFVL